jgi:folate-binding Fe-S cluster repair protein YgfZ
MFGSFRKTCAIGNSAWVANTATIFQRHRRRFATASVLRERGILRVTGSDAFTFLQGQTTNDTRLLQSATGGFCQYTSMLHPKGRVLWEMFAWAGTTLGSGTLLLECDAATLKRLEKRLTMFRMRADFELVDVSGEYTVVALLGASDSAAAACADSVAPGIVAVDPRCRLIGHRILLPSNIDPAAVSNWTAAGPDIYRDARHRLGLPEGMAEIEPDKLFPAEIGLDYLNGISFTVRHWSNLA